MALRVTVLGTSGSVPTVDRNPSSVFVKREGDGMLFDVGEGTQRQMMRFGTGFTVDDVFITHLHGDHVLGLPGLIQTMAFNDRTDALRIRIPYGTGRRFRRFITALGTAPAFDVHIDEVRPDTVVHDRDGYEVRTFETDHDTPSVGYALVESERKGRFDREKAEALGVPVGPKFSQLHEGVPVELEGGRVIEPDDVVGPPRPGRSIVYTGDTRPCDGPISVTDEPDLLFHDGTFASDRADRAAETGHSTAREAAAIASRAGAKRLALLHISARYAGDPSPHREEARSEFDGELLIPSDGDRIEIPYPDS